MTRDEWPKYICCVLTVREELIAENPAMYSKLKYSKHSIRSGADRIGCGS